MSAPPLLDTDYLFGSSRWFDDAIPWDLSVENIQVIQNAFVIYMENGLSLEHIALHMDNTKHGMPDQALLECAMAYCAAAVCIPHPRLSDLLLYVREATRGVDDYEVSSSLGSLFKYNRLRKYEVLTTLDPKRVTLLTTISPVEVEDCILACLINDHAVAHRVYSLIETSELKKATNLVRYFPDRSLGYILDKPHYLGYREMIDKLGVQAKAIMGIPDGTCNLYDRSLWLNQPRPSLDEHWSIKTLRSDEVDHGVLELDELVCTIRQFPGECIDSILGSLWADVINPVPLIDKLMDTFEKAGIGSQEIFSLMCLKTNRVDYLDQQICTPTQHDDYIRKVLRFFSSWHPQPLKQVAENLILKVPVAEIIQACNNDKELKVAYALFRDKRLLVKMSGPARDEAFGADVGL